MVWWSHWKEMKRRSVKRLLNGGKNPSMLRRRSGKTSIRKTPRKKIWNKHKTWEEVVEAMVAAVEEREEAVVEEDAVKDVVRVAVKVAAPLEDPERDVPNLPNLSLLRSRRLHRS
jgi:hypothetical protein